MGDDMDAPHEFVLSLPAEASLRQFVDHFQSNHQHYLASIAFGRATWFLEGQSPLAVLAQQWNEPRFLVSPASSLISLIDAAAQPHLQFRYWCQADPELVFDCLQQGRPLPDRYGR